jgi:hypothetical protein
LFEVTMNNEMYLRRQSKVWVAPGVANLSPEVPAALSKNIEPLGFVLSPALAQRLQTLSIAELTAFYGELVDALRKMVGAHRLWKPMYSNFPQQVMEASQAELYINAIIHYVTGALPHFEKKARLPLFEKTKPRVVELGSPEEFEQIFTHLAAAKTSLSGGDKEDAAWFVAHLKNDVYRLLPPEIPLKENVALIGALLAQHTENSEEFLRAHVKTATDVLRLAVALSGGDVSLFEATKFAATPRPQRRLLLGLLENCPNLCEDMARWEGRWLRLGERLHPGEHKARFPRSFEAFDTLRNKKPFVTFSKQAEAAIQARDGAGLAALLGQRPGEFARRLDHALRLNPESQPAVIEQFAAVAPRVSTPVLLQVVSHFRGRNAGAPLRAFFPKGNVARVQAIENKLAPLDEGICASVVGVCEDALTERFAALEPLGACWVDERLREFPVPFSQRSASKSLRTLVRGSRLALPEGDTLRFFLWWTDGKDRTDIDLSAVLYDADFKYLDVLSYYNLKGFGGHHSGDITSAPQGAAEFIDVSVSKLRAAGVRFVVASLNSYTEQPFCDLPECFAGWMARRHANSGEVFEPRTLQDRVDLASDTRICIPFVADTEAGQVLWTDIALRKDPSWNNVHNNLGGVSLMLRALVGLRKPTLYDLFSLHARARGEIVDDATKAQTVFGLESGLTPFQSDEIVARWL